MYWQAIRIPNSNRETLMNRLTDSGSRSRRSVTGFAGWLMQPLILNALVFSAGSTCLLATADAASYTITDLGRTAGDAMAINSSGSVVGLGFLYDGTMHTLPTLKGQTNEPAFAFGINNTGTVVGYDDFHVVVGGILTFERHAFLYDGTMHDLTPGSSSATFAYAINDVGQVTGSRGSDPFVYDGTMHKLPLVGNFFKGEGRAINALGQVAGWSDDGGGKSATLWDTKTGAMTDLGAALLATNIAGALITTENIAVAINASGQVAGNMGFVNKDFGAIGYLFTPDTPNGSSGTFVQIGRPSAGTFVLTQGVNDRGQVVGYFTGDPSSPSSGSAFIYDASGGLVELNSLIDPASGWNLTRAHAINNSGQIVGMGTVNQQFHSFLLTPIPEPSSFVLAGLGLVGLVGWSWRKRRNLARLGSC